MNLDRSRPGVLRICGRGPRRGGLARGARLTYKPVELPFHWGKLFDRGWFRLELPRTKTKGASLPALERPGGRHAYIGGVPFYGFGRGAPPLPASEKSGHDLRGESLPPERHLASRGHRPRPRSSKLTRAVLMTRDDAAWDAWHDFSVLYDLALEDIERTTRRIPRSSRAEAAWAISSRSRWSHRSTGACCACSTTPRMRSTQAAFPPSATCSNARTGNSAARPTGSARCSRGTPTSTSSGSGRSGRGELQGGAHVLDDEPADGNVPGVRLRLQQPASYDAVKRISPALMDR